MKLNYFEIVYFLLIIYCFKGLSEAASKNETGKYIGAVVEYEPVGNPWSNTPEDLLSLNSQNYIQLIKEAKQNKADIVIFPEYGLTTLSLPQNRLSARPYLQIVSEVGHNPCLENSDDSRTFIVKNLSCGARENHIYTVVNLGELILCSNNTDKDCPQDGAYQYNTNVVFDREGNVIAKYHKYHLYFEDQFDRPLKPEYVTFTTDFGVEFGTFICFDITFYYPSVEYVYNGIKNFIFTSAWVDELPFLTAIQAHSYWAMASGSNLLASGYHKPIGGQLGSGIYSGAHGALNYTFDPDSHTKLIISQIPLIPNDNYHNPKKSHFSKLNKNSEIPNLSNENYHNSITQTAKKSALDSYLTKSINPLLNYKTEHGSKSEFSKYSNKNSEIPLLTSENFHNSKTLAKLHINKKSKVKKLENDYTKASYHAFLKENLQNYSSEPLDMELTEKIGISTVCHGSFCCSLTYSFITLNTIEVPIGNYRLVSFSGLRKVAMETDEFSWEVCGVLRCLNNTISSCTERSENDEISNFKYFELSTSTMDQNQVMRGSLATLDTDFKLIPLSYFKLFRNETVIQVASSYISEIRIQTIALINKTYNK